MPTDVVRTHLEIRSLERLRAANAPDGHIQITRLEHPSPDEYLALYTRIGGPWHWSDRLAWSREELEEYLGSTDVRLHTLEVDGESAGYFELQRRDVGLVEIMYFGLDTRFMGRRLGGYMLTRAVQEAFALGARRVVVNTCSLDAPQALPNYLARGFVITREESYTVNLSATTPSGPP